MRIVVRPLVLVALASLAGCGTEPPDSGEPDPPSVTTPLAQFEKVDLLLVVDNSISMAEKQGVLANSVQGLLAGLVNPPCVDAAGALIEQPSSPAAACPSGSHRRSAPVQDLHIGVISSNLGDLGGSQCDSPLIEAADQAHLRTIGEQGEVPTYQGLGFLAWDPAAELSPPGETSFDTLVASTVEMVAGMGERGCGTEMPLEAMTRFLVDPAPYQTLEQIDGLAELQPSGVDHVLLDQRAAFLRPDSIVAVVLLSDENDCSLTPALSHFLLGGPFYRSTAACEADPEDVCCTSCALPTPVGCAPDPSCEAELKYDSYSDHPNLKCFDQKRRYGVDFHYPVARYANALSAEQIDPALPDLGTSEDSVDNPLFVGERQPEHVIFTTITGVPWQDLTTDPGNGASPLKTSAQMEADGTWTWLLGESGGAPADPFMRESIAPRVGTSPATGESVAGPNSVNGGDRTIVAADLQYACVFPLETPIAGGNDCDACAEQSCDSPLCDGTLQIAGKAYPGSRQLEVARALGDRAVTGSICPPVADAQTPPEGGPGAPQVGRFYSLPLEQLVIRVSELLPDAE